VGNDQQMQMYESSRIIIAWGIASIKWYVFHRTTIIPNIYTEEGCGENLPNIGL
jgi:hypothetical protein